MKKQKNKAEAKPKVEDVYALTEELFGLLDKAKLAPATIITTEKYKEHYETRAMFAFRKLLAARYHLKRIDSLFEEHAAMAKPLLRKEKPGKGLKIASLFASYSQSANEFVYELSAFFQAIRSGADFLARLCVEHTKSVEAESVSHFLKWVNQGKVGPILDVFRKHSEWLMHLQDYRDHLIHKLTISATIGATRQWKHGKWTKSSYPVVVPAHTPKFTPDTRRSRQLEDGMSNLSTSKMAMTVTLPGGKVIKSESSVEYHPLEGYERIEVLMKQELRKFESFFADVVRALIALNFGPAEIGFKKKAK